MTIQELSILRQNGDEITLSFSNTGVLKRRVVDGEAPIETHFFHKDPSRYVDIIDNTLKRENINDAIAISGTFIDDDGSVVEQEGLLGNIFYMNVLSTSEGSDSKETSKPGSNIGIIL